MIHIFIGTKAQFIKVAPVLQQLTKQSISYRLIDSCQHKDITKDLRLLFSIREPDVYLDAGFSNINSMRKAFLWSGKILLRLIISKRRFKQEVFGSAPDGICLIHGDTLSTLLGLITAKSCGIKVAHLEAGLRSFDIFNPFPEELIRIICMRYSDFLFTPSAWASENLNKMGIKGTVFSVHANTIIDALDYIVHQNPNEELNLKKPYCTVSIHRFENIFSKKRLQSIINLIISLSKDMTIYFMLHQPTHDKLHRMNMLKSLHGNSKIHMVPLEQYNNFIRLLSGAEFIITDGGSIQEESYALNVPCLLMREKTERQDGLGENVCLSKFDTETIQKFLNSYKSFRRKNLSDAYHPSENIVAILHEISH
ncbi:UDP-N-acetyl glucosamine 2-epimerase [Candidatus Omnitrophota bacterium]